MRSELQPLGGREELPLIVTMDMLANVHGHEVLLKPVGIRIQKAPSKCDITLVIGETTIQRGRVEAFINGTDWRAKIS